MERVERKSLRQMSRGRDLWKRMKKYWPLLVLVLIPLTMVFVFNYAAYPGLRIVFMNYKPALGFARSKWVGWEIFEKVFDDLQTFKKVCKARRQGCK